MDIAKYIGLFLEKNQYCYLPNLGNFIVNKKSATHADGSMQAPKYEVEFKFSGGLIDDSFPNFVANNERISIASAANGVREFAVQTRQTLNEGGEVIIPGFGKFVNVNGKNDFIPEANITVAGPTVPVFKINTEAVNSTLGNSSISELIEKSQIKDLSSDDEVVIKPPTINWSKVILLILLVLAIIGAIYGAFIYLGKSDNNVEAAKTETPAAIPNKDTAAIAQSATHPATTAVDLNNISFGILKYNDQAAADKKQKQLASFGHDVSVKQIDSSFYVAIKVANLVDSTFAKDSLKRFFNPKGEVIIIK